MSLVAYGSSDESENEEETNEQQQKQLETSTILEQEMNTSFSKLQLPTPKLNTINTENDDEVVKTPNTPSQDSNTNHCELKLPTPKSSTIDVDNTIEEADEAPLPRKINYGDIEKPPPKKRGPVKITIPSPSDFDDLDDNNERSSSKVKPSQKGSGLLSMLPPPKSRIQTGIKSSMVPYVLTKKPVEPNKITSTKTVVPQSVKRIEKSAAQSKSATSTLKSLSNYNSDSDEEDDKGTSSGIDFFSLTADTKIPDHQLQPMSTEDIEVIAGLSSSSKFNNDNNGSSNTEHSELDRKLISNVMNLPKEEILLKNKAEVGPKLPVPEQEYNVDSQGNIAFDEKAIEYLCGKRGVKRKNEFSNVDIVEISGEDMKPDEKEWLVKALTEETVQRTSASAGAGPSGQSKKKHQITYLAHQAKAMELELKNQWALNKASRQQTRSKYGF